MTELTDEAVKALLDGATPGRRVQFHGSYCPEAVGTPFTDWDTSHDVSVIRPDGSRYRLAHYKHASDAYLSQMAPDLARALLDARAELAQARAAQAATIERAAEMAAEIHSSLAAAIHSLADPSGVEALAALRAERDRMNQWRETAIVERDIYSEERDDALARLAAAEAEAQKREARYQEALIWCSGSEDFQTDGQACAGWLKLCAPLIDRAALSAAPTGEESNE